MDFVGHSKSRAGPTPRAVLFDLDDTLVDSFDARRRALDSVFRDAGIESPTAEQFLRRLNGAQLFGTLDLLTGGGRTKEKGLSDSYRDAYWTEATGLIGLYPGIKRLLEDLHSPGVKLGVVTQKGREFEVRERLVGAAHELGRLGVAGLFSTVVGFEDVSRYKPDPEGIVLAMSRLGVLPGETLVVGDSAADIEAANAAGCKSCQATWGVPASGSSLGAVADYVVDSPAEVRSLVL